jgi:hypothetical protein
MEMMHLSLRSSKLLGFESLGAIGRSLSWDLPASLVTSRSVEKLPLTCVRRWTAWLVVDLGLCLGFG